MAARGRWSRQSWVVQLMFSVALVLAVLPSLVAAECLVESRSWNWGQTTAFAMPALGGFLGARLTRFFRPEEDRAVDAGVAEALRTGEFPAGTNPRAWRSLLSQRLGVLHALKWIAVVFGFGGGVLTATAGVLTSHGAVGIWLIAAAQELAAATVLALVVPRVRNGRRLLTQLRSES